MVMLFGVIFATADLVGLLVGVVCLIQGLRSALAGGGAQSGEITFTVFGILSISGKTQAIGTMAVGLALVLASSGYALKAYEMGSLLLNYRRHRVPNREDFEQ
jgi:hypothetical protein